MPDSQHLEDLKEHFECALLSIKKQALSIFVQELMPILAAQNYLFDDLLEALAEYSETRSDWARATELLDRAVDEVRDVRRQLTGK